ncbi:ferric reductase-like transmembrane domain-containing protein [Candidatus Peregrinibacteria bacterium]|nr:ferric reductase-like transmembrane domain-containing protein [Candidatus Peregrinibacteria bacterium]
MSFLKNLILNGKIPYFRIIRRIVLFLWVLPVLSYIFLDIGFLKYGELGWKLLITVMLIRPLSDVIPDIKIFKALVPLRKEVGILSGVLIAIHSYGYFAIKNKNIFIEIFNSQYWNFNGIFSWGIIGFIAVIILLITSNNLSIHLLKNSWKKIQQLAYVLFFASAIHITLVNKNEMIKVIIPVSIVMILWIMAKFRITIPKRKPENAEKTE